jgi:hypothetical protein
MEKIRKWKIYINRPIYILVCCLFGISSIISSIFFEISKLAVLFWLSFGLFLISWFGIQIILPSKIYLLIVIISFAFFVISMILWFFLNVYADLFSLIGGYGLEFALICLSEYPLILFLKKRIKHSPLKDLELKQHENIRIRIQIKSIFQLMSIISLYSSLVIIFYIYVVLS